MAQGLDVVQEALGLLDFCQELVHIPASVDLGVVGAISHLEGPWLLAMAKAVKGKQPCELLKLSGRLSKPDIKNWGL